MTAPDGSTLDRPPLNEGRATASMPARVAAALAGVAAMLVLAVITIGIALLALVGLAIGARIDRSRGQSPSRQTTWLGACAGAAIPIAVFMLFAVSHTLRRPDFVAAVRDSARARQEHPPASPTIFERLAGAGRRAPPSKADSAVAQAVSAPLVWWFMLTGGVLASGVLGLIVGTAAWGCGMVAAFGFKGRWPFPSTHDPIGNSVGVRGMS